ncbi:MAG: DNA repair protein RadC [Desulfovibrio sp.]|jgi:DNA repair protein RadC|nr:DNA repair protein RadC [Desulfovibrio sp.]
MTRQGHRERLRARFAAAPASLADYELLELLLTFVLARRDTKDPAKDLLARFSSLRAVINARPEEVEEIAGLGPAAGLLLSLIRELAARSAEEPLSRRESLCSPSAVAAMARQRLSALEHEEIWAAYVDGGNRLLRWEQAARGTADAAFLQPRAVMERALALSASGLILVHNHPGGQYAPSRPDRELTLRLRQAAETLDIRFLDHIIVSGDAAYSLMSGGPV